MHICGRGHELRGPQDKMTDGSCRHCHNDRQDKYRQRVKLSMALLHAAEARGLAGFEAISVLQNVDYKTLQECVSQGFQPTSGKPL